MCKKNIKKAPVIYDQYPAEALAQLPRLLFEGSIVVIDCPDDVQPAIDIMRKSVVVGIDTETRPSFKKGVSWRVGLLQIATPRQVFLFRLNSIGFPLSLCAFIEDPTILKVGLSLHDDMLSLKQRHAQLAPAGLVELQELATQVGIKDKSLKKLVANLLRQRLSKRQQLSNWNAPALTLQQQRYAATDAWVCLELYNQLNKLITTGNYHLMVTEQPVANE